MNQISSSQLEQVFSRIPKALDSNSLASRFSVWLAQHPASHVLVTISTVLAILGSLASITSIPCTSLPPSTDDPLFDPTDLELEGEKSEIGVDEQDAIVIPVCCGATLVALFYSDLLVTVLSYGFVLLGIIASTFVYSHSFNTLARFLGRWSPIDPLKINPRCRLTFSDGNRFLHPISWFSPNLTYKVILSEELYDCEGEELCDPEEEPPSDIPSSAQIANAYLRLDIIPSLILSVVLVKSSPTLPIIPMNCAIYAITQIKYENLKSATFVLGALVLYDAYFVFYTPLMVNAAHLDIPIKIQLPTGLIGLGDIVLPGMFISLCYKYDIYKWHQSHPATEFHLNRFYWGLYASMATVSYTVGLACCFVALKHFKAAQPALLYVVPAQLIPVLLLSWLKDGLEMWDFRYENTCGTGLKANQDKLGATVFLLEEEPDYVEDDDSDFVPLSDEDEEDLEVEENEEEDEDEAWEKGDD